MKTILALLSAILGFFTLSTSMANQPNIVFIMADDLGNADLGYRGGQVKDTQHRQTGNPGHSL